jgi:hypothetical protein
LKLEPHELESAVAKKLAACYEQKLEICRKQNDGNLDTESTVRLRGRIAEIKALLSIVSPEDTSNSGAE